MALSGFLVENSKLLKVSSDDTPSHTIQIGSKQLNIKTKIIENTFNLSASYLADIKDNKHPDRCIFENIGNNLKYFVDITLPENIKPLQLTKIIHSTVCLFTDDDTNRVIILKSDENTVRYVFPTFFVSRENAAIITTRVIAELAAADTKDTTYRWSNLVNNPKVYVSKNFNVAFPYSIPTSPCPHCVNLGKKSKAECLACGGAPIMEPNKVFVPTYDVCFTSGNIRKYEDTLSLSDFIACCVSHPYSSTTYQAPLIDNVKYPVGTPHCC